MGICSDFANARNPCVHAGVQIGMAYVSPLLGESSCACSSGVQHLTAGLRISLGRLYHLVDRQVSRCCQGNATVSDYKGAQLAFRCVRA